MGTSKTRYEKIEWMKMAVKAFKDDEVILKNFVIKFHSTMNTAKEVLNTIRWQKTLNQTLD